MSRPPVDWPTFLAGFHAERPGITEGVLTRCTSDLGSPYEWLVEGIAPADRHLDLACGSGPARHPDARRWVGLDLSAAELGAAARRGRRSLVRADVTRTPVRTGGADVVTCSLALMLVDPLEEALAEAHRVLRPSGELRLLLPAGSPLGARDVVRYLRLFAAARATTAFPPTPLRRAAGPTLGAGGFTVVEDRAVRFTHPVEGPDDADRFVSSWYLPGVRPSRLDAARRRATAMAPFTIGVPLRRLVARRT